MTSLLTIGFVKAAGFANPTLNAPALQNAADKWDITSAARVVSWMSMLGVEGQALTEMAENMFYTDPAWLRTVFPSHFPTAISAAPYVKNPEKLGNFVYAGIGKVEGGYAARGLGWGQVTGDDNHLAYAAAVGKSLHEARAYMQTAVGAADSAGWFFHTKGCAARADANDLLGVRRLWTGTRPPRTPLGMAEALKWQRQCQTALGLPVGPLAGAAKAVADNRSAAATSVGQPPSQSVSETDRLNQGQIDKFAPPSA